MTHFFFVENLLEELEIGEDVEIVFKKENFLETDINRQTFKTALEAIGRKDLTNKLDIYIAAGN